jgi:DNA-binding NarL/FixJ family response regulator
MTVMTMENSIRKQGGKSRILLVDDHPLVRRGVADMLAREADMEVCGEAADVSEAMRLMERTQPDMVLVDLTLRSGHGIELIEKIKARDPHIKTLVSSMHDETLFAERVLQAGAMGYITKQEAPETLLGAIRQVLQGEVYLSPRMTSRLLHRVASGTSLGDDPIRNLSNREMQVYEMIGQGLTIQQIALRLHLSPKTVETHREKLKQKLNLKTSTELNRRAVQWVLEGGKCSETPEAPLNDGE